MIKEYPESQEYTEVTLDAATKAILFTDGMLVVKQGTATLLLSDVAAMHLANLLLSRSQEGEEDNG